MENASKALLMAGAVLIALLIISLGIMVFNNMSNSVVNDSSLQKEEITSFNSKITPYLGKNKSGSQVRRLIQLVRSIDQNALNSDDSDRRVSIYYQSTPLVKLGKTDTKILENATTIRNLVVTNLYYSVSEEYDENGLITKIIISKNDT